jgi:hypothetical protein
LSLLAGLRAAAPADLQEPPWNLFKRTLPLLVPGFELTKMETFSGGRVGVRGRSPLRGAGRFFVVMVMDEVDKGLPDGRREVRAGVSKYRDEADLQIFDRPFWAYVDPQPGAVAVWLAGILLTEEQYSANRLSG